MGESGSLESKKKTTHSRSHFSSILSPARAAPPLHNPRTHSRVPPSPPTLHMSGDRGAPPAEAPPPGGGTDARAIGALPPEALAALQVREEWAAHESLCDAVSSRKETKNSP